MPKKISKFIFLDFFFCYIFILVSLQIHVRLIPNLFLIDYKSNTGIEYIFNIGRYPHLAGVLNQTTAIIIQFLCMKL